MAINCKKCFGRGFIWGKRTWKQAPGGMIRVQTSFNCERCNGSGDEPFKSTGIFIVLFSTNFFDQPKFIGTRMSYSAAVKLALKKGSEGQEVMIYNHYLNEFEFHYIKKANETLELDPI